MLGYKICFFFSIFSLFYVYAGYPVCVWFFGRLRRKKIDKAAFEPTVSILISAYNEDDHIGQTIANKLQLDYPKSKLEIIVISDESTDQTDNVIKEFDEENVKFLRQIPRAGKTVINRCRMKMGTG
jgi:cellulose synthase/poly-beta-1,6-N-acetylglucosamine synthase-like glycosyltransferase